MSEPQCQRRGTQATCSPSVRSTYTTCTATAESALPAYQSLVEAALRYLPATTMVAQVHIVHGSVWALSYATMPPPCHYGMPRQ
jgi:hypothetical protein